MTDQSESRQETPNGSEKPWTPLTARAFNAVQPALRDAGEWIPLTARRAIADAVLAEIEPELARGRKAESLLLHFTAEAHRRKWDYDRGLDDDGQPIPSPAFNALHRLGDEMNVELHKLRAESTKEITK